MTGIGTESGSSASEKGRHSYYMIEELLSIEMTTGLRMNKGKKLSMWMGKHFVSSTLNFKGCTGKRSLKNPGEYAQAQGHDGYKREDDVLATTNKKAFINIFEIGGKLRFPVGLIWIFGAIFRIARCN